jgi:hypothetical protein
MATELKSFTRLRTTSLRQNRIGSAANPSAAKAADPKMIHPKSQVSPFINVLSRPGRLAIDPKTKGTRSVK